MVHYNWIHGYANKVYEMRRNGHWLFGSSNMSSYLAGTSGDGGGGRKGGDGPVECEGGYRDLAQTSPATTGKAAGPRWAGGPGAG